LSILDKASTVYKKSSSAEGLFLNDVAFGNDDAALMMLPSAIFLNIIKAY
jgi:hypothetical protein